MLAEISSVFERLGLSLQSGVILVLAGSLGLLIAAAIMFVMKRIALFEKTSLVAAIAARCAAPLRFLLPVMGMSAALPGLDTSTG